jgi:hypothetical protein
MAPKTASVWLLPTPRAPASACAAPRPRPTLDSASTQRASKSEVMSVNR